MSEIQNYKLLKRIKEKAKGKKITATKMKVLPKESDNLMDMLKAGLTGKKSKSA